MRACGGILEKMILDALEHLGVISAAELQDIHVIGPQFVVPPPIQITGRKRKRVDNGVVTFKCEHCTYQTTAKGHYHRHQKLHTGGGDRLFPCLYIGCDFQAKEKHHLQQHSLTHTREKPFACDILNCGYSCGRLHDLIKHKQKHSKDDNVPCSMCDFKCSSQRKLKAHMKEHNNIKKMEAMRSKPLKCEEPGCEYRASSMSVIVKHRIAKHGYVSHLFFSNNVPYSIFFPTDL